MSIILDATPRTKKGGTERWRASWQEDYRWWLAPYFEPDVPRYREVLARQWQRLGLHCLSSYLVPWSGENRVPSKQVLVDLRGRRIAFLSRFHRTFSYRIDDHDVSPYDEHFRRSGVTDYTGGYITAGWGDDGIAIHAPTEKFGPTDDDFEMRWDEFYFSEEGSLRRSGDSTFAEVPAPNAECPWIDLFRFSTSRATRVIPAVLWESGPVVLLFKDERKALPVALWKPDRKFIHWKRPSPQVLLTWPTSPRWTNLFLSSPVLTSRPIPKGTPWPFQPPVEDPGPPREWIRRKYGPAVGMKLRTPHGWYTQVRQPRETWPDGWRTERKMRNTAATLKMYDYGRDGLINVRRMQDTARKNYATAWKARNKACGIGAKQTFWPGGDNTPRGSTESSPVDGPGTIQLCGATKADCYQ